MKGETARDRRQGLAGNRATTLGPVCVVKLNATGLFHAAYGKQAIHLGMKHGLESRQPSSRHVVVMNTSGWVCLFGRRCQVKILKEIQLVCHGRRHNVLATGRKKGRVDRASTIVVGNRTRSLLSAAAQSTGCKLSNVPKIYLAIETGSNQAVTIGMQTLVVVESTMGLETLQESRQIVPYLSVLIFFSLNSS